MSINKIINEINFFYKLATKICSDKKNKHNFIQHKVCALAKKYNCVGKEEYQIKEAYKTKEGKVRVGYIDVVWFYKDKIILAFEVDSQYRNKSIDKLLKVNSKYKLWLCYQENFSYPIKKKEEIYYILPFYKWDKKPDMVINH